MCILIKLKTSIGNIYTCIHMTIILLHIGCISIYVRCTIRCNLLALQRQNVPFEKKKDECARFAIFLFNFQFPSILCRTIDTHVQCAHSFSDHTLCAIVKLAVQVVIGCSLVDFWLRHACNQNDRTRIISMRVQIEFKSFPRSSIVYTQHAIDKQQQQQMHPKMRKYTSQAKA